MRSVKVMLVICCVILLGILLWYGIAAQARVELQYIYASDGMVHLVNLYTGKLSEAPVEDFCKEHATSVVWLRKEKAQYVASSQNVARVYVSDAQGETRFLFDTERLAGEVGVADISIEDIDVTENGRIIFTAREGGGREASLLEYRNDGFVRLYDGGVMMSFSTYGGKLLFTASDGEPSVCALDLYDDTAEILTEGENAAYLDAHTMICFSGQRNGKARILDLETGEETAVARDSRTLYENIQSYRAPLVSPDGRFAIVYYYDSVGADDTAEIMGLYDIQRNRLVNVDWYFQWVLFRKPVRLPYRTLGVVSEGVIGVE